MDLSLIKSKLDSFQNKGQSKEKIDYSKIFWKPKAGKHQVRIIPSKFNKSNPFREIYFHYGYTKAPILALSNWGEADPIVEAAQKLRKSDNPDHWAMAKKITPKMRVFAPVVVRGEEGNGVRLWEFGKEIYTQLMNIAMNEDYGDFTDVSEGRDFVVEGIDSEMLGKKVVKCTLTPRVKTSAITEDATLLTSYLEDQPDIMSINKKHTYESLNEIFQKWANPEDEDDNESIVTKDEDDTESSTKDDSKFDDMPWDDKANSNVGVQSAAPVKKAKADKFDALFEE
jgi:hypothetical protein